MRRHRGNNWNNHRRFPHHGNQHRRRNWVYRALRGNRGLLLPLIILAALAIGQKYKGHSIISGWRTGGATERSQSFTCAGKQYCSQMTSCDEAIFYVESCGVTTMDGDGDGVPCERGVCGR